MIDYFLNYELIFCQKLIEKNKDNKVKLKEIRKEHNIPIEEFYAKVKELKA